MDRKMARQVIRADRFIEVYLDAPLEVSEKRDPKGLYRKARRGEIAAFTGISAPYDPPEAPTAVMHSATQRIDECLRELFEIVMSRSKSKKTS